MTIGSNRNRKSANRRSFLRQGLGAAAVGAGVLTSTGSALAQSPATSNSGRLSSGDVAILKFVAAAELIETDLWQQYAELGGVTKGLQTPYQKAFQNLDGDASQYISSNTLDEASHASFLNAYLMSKGETPINLDVFRTLPSSQAKGAQQIGRLTNLTQLTVDTSWYTRYRSSDNPDFGATFPQAIPALSAGPIHRDSTNQLGLLSGKSCSGHRQHCRLSFCLYRTGRFQFVPDSGAERYKRRSAADHDEYRR